MLTADEIHFFVENGYVIARRAFSPHVVAEWTGWCRQRLRYTPDAYRVAGQSFYRLPGLITVDGRALCPRGWTGACQLLGGENRVAGGWSVSDAFIVNEPVRSHGQWSAPSVESGEWHIDGDTFRHFLDSPDWAVVGITIWTDTLLNGGATLVAEGSVRLVSQYLLDHPEGVDAFNFGTLLGDGPFCWRQLEAKAGDIIFLHPFLIHASSPNHSPDLRIITTRSFDLREPMSFQRADGSAHSPVERSVLRALNREGIPFHRTRASLRREPARLSSATSQAADELRRLRSIVRSEPIHVGVSR